MSHGSDELALDPRPPPGGGLRYRVIGPLGQGGMGEVSFAQAQGVGGFSRAVVIKRLRPEVAGDPAVVRMFLDEARLCAALYHPHIVQMLDVGRDDEGVYLAMEHLRGYDLMTVLRRAARRGQRLPLGVAVWITQAACLGLHHAHEARGPSGEPLGLVHRDVSPHNVLATFEGEVKVIDFGIAKVADGVGGTRTGAIKGKLGYMSPEQCRGRALDRRSDVFGLGILLLELTTGARVYAGDDDYEVLRAIVEDPPPRPTRWDAGYPTALEAVALRALAPEPDARYATALAMHEALDDAARALGGVAGARDLARVMRELFGEELARWNAARGDPARELSALTVPREAELAALAARSTAAVATPSPEAPRTATAPRWAPPRRRRAAAVLSVAIGAAALAPLALTRWRDVAPPRPAAEPLPPASVGAPRGAVGPAGAAAARGAAASASTSAARDPAAPAAAAPAAAPAPATSSRRLSEDRTKRRRAAPRASEHRATAEPPPARATAAPAAIAPGPPAVAPPSATTPAPPPSATTPAPPPPARTAKDCPDDDCVL